MREDMCKGAENMGEVMLKRQVVTGYTILFKSSANTYRRDRHRHL